MLRAMLIAAISSGVALTYQSPAADACGVKLVMVGPKLNSSKSKHPSKILIIGQKDSPLIKRLRLAKHNVDRVSLVSDASSTSYHLVIADNDQFDAARSTFSKSEVIRKQGSSTDTSRFVERVLGRKRVASTRVDRVGVVSRTRDRKIVESGSENRAPVRVPVETGDEVATSTVPDAKRVETSSRPEVSVEAKAEPQEEPKVSVATPAKNDSARVARGNKTRDTASAPTREALVKVAKWSPQFGFGSNSISLSPGAQQKLRGNAAWLQQNPTASITIGGHTDTVGDENYNLELSERRANVAKDFLLSIGVESSRISVDANGESEPAYEPGTSGKNRRIVLTKN